MDDQPSVPSAVQDSIGSRGMARRNLLRHSGAAVAGLALAAAGVQAQSQTVAAAAANPQALDTFYRLSRLLTGHENLDLTVGEHLYDAMLKLNPAFAGQVTELSQYAASHKLDTVEALEAALKGQPLHVPLMAIISAWYSGVVEPGTSATVYAYERALMYQMSRDGMVIPTYAHNGPNYWVAEPPPLDRLPVF
ncbi:sorbitol dehydrogenase family protein [Frateuria aurantia]